MLYYEAWLVKTIIKMFITLIEIKKSVVLIFI